MKQAMIDHANARVSAKKPYAQPVSERMLELMDSEYNWLQNPVDENSPKFITWDKHQAKWIAMIVSNLSVWIENNGVTQPELRDTEYYHKTDPDTGEAWNASSIWADIIVGKLTEIATKDDTKYVRATGKTVSNAYKIGAKNEERFKTEIEPTLSPTLASIFNTLSNGEPCEVTVTKNRDQRLTDSHERDAEGNYVNARASRTRKGAWVDAPRATEEVHHFTVTIENNEPDQKVRQQIEDLFYFTMNSFPLNGNAVDDTYKGLKATVKGKVKAIACTHHYVIDDSGLGTCNKCGATKQHKL